MGAEDAVERAARFEQEKHSAHEAMRRAEDRELRALARLDEANAVVVALEAEVRNPLQTCEDRGKAMDRAEAEVARLRNTTLAAANEKLLVMIAVVEMEVERLKDAAGAAT
jgi:hypothetical protein